MSFDALSMIGERRIADAVARGEFDELPGKGEPIEIEDLSRVPEDLRAGYLALKGAGFVPEEIALRRELLTLNDLLDACRDPEREEGLRSQLSATRLQLDAILERRGRSPAFAEYGERVDARLNGD